MGVGKKDVLFKRIANIWTAVNEYKGNTGEVHPVKQRVFEGVLVYILIPTCKN